MCLKENDPEKLDFTELKNLDDSSVGNFNRLCIVQNHTKLKFRLKEIYKKSLVPFIYDCQNKVVKDSKSKTLLKTFGNK